MTDYTIIVKPDDNNTFVAYVPAIKGCHAWGKLSYIYLTVSINASC
ncbi:type II toxin-antitoxin system HicB family antitoxin [Geminocystis sp. CENA526]